MRGPHTWRQAGSLPVRAAQPFTVLPPATCALLPRPARQLKGSCATFPRPVFQQQGPKKQVPNNENHKSSTLTQHHDAP